MRKINNKVTCRPCKEKNDWEIEANGQVLKRHYNTKTDCVRAGRNYAQEFGYELIVENKNNNKE